MNHICPGCSICLICGALPSLARIFNGTLSEASEEYRRDQVLALTQKLHATINEFHRESKVNTLEVLGAVLSLAGFIADDRVLDDEERARFSRLADELGPLISHYLNSNAPKEHPTVH